MDAFCVAGVRRGRSAGPEMSLPNMALERGISHIIVRRRWTRGHVCGGEGIYGGVAYLIRREVGGGDTIRVVWVVGVGVLEVLEVVLAGGVGWKDVSGMGGVGVIEVVVAGLGAIGDKTGMGVVGVVVIEVVVAGGVVAGGAVVGEFT